MKHVVAKSSAKAAVLILLLAGTAPAHPYTTWQEDGMASDAHTHVNSGDYDFSGQGVDSGVGAVVTSGGYYTADGILVTEHGYFLRDGTFVEGRYVEGSVFNGGEVAGNTIITGGGIVSLYGYEETRTTVTKTAAGNTVQAGLQLTAKTQAGGVGMQVDGTPYHCWCAFSADGERVPVFATASENASVPKHYVGGGTKTFDVESYLKGFWKVSWREKDGGIQYGWVREERVACKRTLTR